MKERSCNPLGPTDSYVFLPYRRLRKIVEERFNCYLVPMDDVMYSLVVPYVSEGNNFRVFINNYDKFYSTNLENRSDELMVICKPTDHHGTLYSLKTNKIVYHGRNTQARWMAEC